MDTKLDKLAAATRGILNVHDIVLSLDDDALSADVRALADRTKAASRIAIMQGMTAPADAFARHKLLEAAIELDGVGSALAAAAARRFAEAAAAEAEADDLIASSSGLRHK